MIATSRNAALTFLAAALLAACGSSPPGTTAAGGSPSPQSCRAQYGAWKNGPARAAALKVAADSRAFGTAASAEDYKRMQVTLERLGHDAAAVEAYPMPRCADPHGYWHQFLAGLKAGADNASTGSGLGALLLAMGPLQKAKAAENKLNAELKQTVQGTAVASQSPAAAPRQSPAAAVIAARMKATGIPIRHLIVYTPKTDPNHMMGRQGGYTSKVAWVDRAAVKAGAGNPSADPGGTEYGGGIEVYPTAEGARARDTYLSGFKPPFGDGWDYVAGTAVLRLSHYLTPAQASAYRTAFQEAAG